MNMKECFDFLDSKFDDPELVNDADALAQNIITRYNLITGGTGQMTIDVDAYYINVLAATWYECEKVLKSRGFTKFSMEWIPPARIGIISVATNTDTALYEPRPIRRLLHVKK